MQFVNLHNYSNYSILQSLPSPTALVKRAKEIGQPSVALTDRGTLAGAWEAFKAARDADIKLIIGCDFYFAEDRTVKEDKLKHLTLLATSHKGYRNILALNKEGFETSVIAGRKVLSVIDWKLLEGHSEDLICLTGCANGVVAQYLNAENPEKAEENLVRLIKIFGKEQLAVELQAHNLNRGATIYEEKIDQVFTNRQMNLLAEKHDLRVVATSSTFYLKKEDAELHDVLLSIGAMQPMYSNARPKYISSPHFYLKTGEEIFKFFSRTLGKDRAKELVDNSIFFADKCEPSKWIDPKFSNPSGKELPLYPIKDDEFYDDFIVWLDEQSQLIKKLPVDQAFLRFQCERLLKKRIPISEHQKYKERIEKELDTFEYQNASSYMLIVADYISWARKNGVSVGPGRGSCGGSLVAYLLDIHRVNPFQYGLVFERFYNKLKKDFSDIDTDFARDTRYKVEEYIIQKYGKDHVAHVSNAVGITPKVYVRDIARSCEFGGDRKKAVEIGNAIADSFLAAHKSIDAIIDNSALFNEYAKIYPKVLQYKSICGALRGSSTHAAGIVIGSRPLHNIVPIRKDKDGSVAIEYNKDSAEENGLVKMDLLGLSTLDIIDRVKDLIKKNGKVVPEIDYDKYDEKTYDLITSGNTFGVFQFGTSAGTIDLCKKIKPKSIEDLAVITTLARPASAEIREDFIKTREKGGMNKLIHPSLKNALKESFGFPLYDESLLILAEDVAGWDLAEADKLRKLTKEKGKNPLKVEKWHQEFLEGGKNNNIHEETAKQIWEAIIVPFGRYSFNKAHAIAYSMISYTTAYLKAHFPLEFLLANLMEELNSNALNSEENVVKIKKEIKNLGIKILPPNINSSEMHYKMIDDNNLLTGLEALKFVSEDAIDEIVTKRPFSSFHDFMLRCNTTKMRSNAIQALAASGCLDSFGLPRKQMYLYCQEYRKKLQVWLKRHDPITDSFEFPFPDKKEWDKSELYALENHYVGEVFSVKKEHAYGDFFKDKKYSSLSYVKRQGDRQQIPSIKAEVRSVFELKVKKEGSKYLGQDMAKVSLEDVHGFPLSMTVFPDKWKEIKQNRHAIGVGTAIHFAGVTNVYNGEMGLILERLLKVAPPPQLPRNLSQKKLVKEKDVEKDNKDLIDELEDALFSD